MELLMHLSAILGLAAWTCTFYVSALPTVDPGLFVISGVKTCGNGDGYCLLGSDCSLDQDFTEDKTGGHCGGLKKAFTPSAHFVCCTDSKPANEVEIGVAQVPMTDSNDDESGELEANSTKVPSDFISITTDASETTTFEVLKDALSVENDGNTAVDKEILATSPVNGCDPCNSTMRLVAFDNQLCLGSHVGKGWVVTSASCAMKIFRIGMVNVVAEFVDESELVKSVKTIVVNENYRPTASSVSLPETNNLGLIQLNDTMSDRCSPCLPVKGQTFGGQRCQTMLNATSEDQDPFPCESEIETMQGEANEEFLTLACEQPSQSRYFAPDTDIGKPLSCGGHLVGVETSSGVGMTVFTQLSLYSDWLRQNIIKPAPQQSYRTNL